MKADQERKQAWQLLLSYLLRIAALGAFVPVLLLWPKIATASFHPAAQASKSVVVERRDGDVTILPSGDVRMVETWVVQFHGGPFHNAFRTIDTSRVEQVADVGISEGDQTYSRTSGGSADNTVTVDANSRYTTITWYFPSATDATRTFTLHYTLRGVVRIYPGGDQFWYKFIEADRAYPINAAHVAEHLPAAFTADQIKLATYPGS